MTETECNEAAQMRRRLIQYIDLTHEQIIAYPPNSDDNDYRFLIQKAIYYQELIDRLDQQINAPND